jgi:hypothetical protein
MKILNQYKNIKIEKSVEGRDNMLIGNDLGNFFFLNNDEETRYQGFYFMDCSGYEKKPEVFKVIDDIKIRERDEPEELKNNFFKLERKSKNGLVESYFLPSGHNSLCLKTSRLAEAEVILDMRRPYDSRQMGRFYKIEMQDDCVIIEFTKRRDWSEDNLGDKKEFSLYLAVKCDKDSYRKIGVFFSKYYPKDHKRNSPPWDRQVFQALSMTFKKAVFSVAKSKKQALLEAQTVFRDFDKLYKKERDEYCSLELPKITDSEIRMACLCAQNSIRTLTVRNKFSGCYAGMPWFFQFWHRDEALSLYQIHKLNRKVAEEIINAQLDIALSCGAYPCVRHEESNRNLQSADALGYLAKNCYDLFRENCISKNLRQGIVSKFEKMIPALLKERTMDGLAINYAHETWMDSLDRSGARIEMQAGRLALYKLLYSETDNDQYKILIDELVRKTLDRFYHDEKLLDSPESKTIRPNVFLACYLYPDLLTRDQWEKCFDAILPELYLEWGGIASVSTNDTKFITADSGESSPSYHNGDSWYFMNNIVATVLYRINPVRYSNFINEIMEASTREILYMGSVGHHAEISSASVQGSLGCEAQLWSSAMYLGFFDAIMDD